ncbi:helix-turn-helix transcriptional regulator [Bacteroides acidifaciens]|uniref:helix-turn-helix transcriptional regulator n=1 Tax=Bacteroides acidifaciens TaxID=85831 RepID=UPI003013E88F
MKTTNDFFIPDNEVKLPEELDYSRVDEYIRSAEAFSRSTYQSVYIIDYFKQNFLYVSPNPMFLCGLTPEQMMKLGYRFYLEYVPEDEQQFLIDLNEAGFSFHNTIPVKERKDWYISYDFNILNGGRKILVNHKLTPLVLTSDGRIWLALCVVSASTHTSPGHIEMHRVGTPDYVEYNRNTHRWDKRQMPTLTDGERLFSLCRFRATPCRRLPTEYACRQTPSRNTASTYLRNLMCAISPKPLLQLQITSYSKFLHK